VDPSWQLVFQQLYRQQTGFTVLTEFRNLVITKFSTYKITLPRAENRRFWLLSALRAIKKARYKTDLHMKCK
jgi:hypothetical protein